MENYEYLGSIILDIKVILDKKLKKLVLNAFKLNNFFKVNEIISPLSKV